MLSIDEAIAFERQQAKDKRNEHYTWSDGEMNLLEHYIKEIHNVQDVSDKYEKAIRHKPKEPLYEVDVTVDCYGVVERKRRIMSKSEFERAKKQGYFLA